MDCKLDSYSLTTFDLLTTRPTSERKTPRRGCCRSTCSISAARVLVHGTENAPEASRVAGNSLTFPLDDLGAGTRTEAYNNTG